MDAFGDQNLEEAVEEALSNSEITFRYDLDPDEEKLRVRRKTDCDSGRDLSEMNYRAFEALFNPETGLKDVPSNLEFEAISVRTTTLVYESTLCTKTVNLAGEQVEKIRDGAISTGRYSEETFRQLYLEEVNPR